MDTDGHSADAAQGTDCLGDGAPPRGTGEASVSLGCCPALIHITGLYITFDTEVGDAGLHVSITPKLWGLCALHCPPSGQDGHVPGATPTSTGADFQTPGCGSQNGSSCLVCKDKEQGGRTGVCIVIPYPW